MNNINDKRKWFVHDRFGLFIHWGPSAEIGHGEQAMFRDHLDVMEYERKACEWNPSFGDIKEWAAVAKDMGVKYACLTTRHHDGYCLWDSAYTDYSSAKQAPKRDFVREYVDAFRAQGIKIGLYYSWVDWRIPAFFEGPEKAPEAFAEFREYMHNQVIELLTNYGKIDYFFFDGAWPRSPEELKSVELVEKMRKLQPGILINNRLGQTPSDLTGSSKDGGLGAGESTTLGDFSTPEREITADSNRIWESCQTSTWRLWGYNRGEHWFSSAQLLDMLCECAEKGGNLILNVGPDKEGRIPPEFHMRAAEIGDWLRVHGEAIYGTSKGNVTEFVTRGRQTVKENNLYLIIRFWDGNPVLRLADLVSDVKSVTLLTTGQQLDFEKKGDVLYIYGLPKVNPCRLFPVIRVECDGAPEANQWGRERLWHGDPQRIADWAAEHGNDVYVAKYE